MKTAVEPSTCPKSISASDATAANEEVTEIANAARNSTLSPNIIIAANFKLIAPLIPSTAAATMVNIPSSIAVLHDVFSRN
jgi:hypothetical protein